MFFYCSNWVTKGIPSTSRRCRQAIFLAKTHTHTHYKKNPWHKDSIVSNTFSCCSLGEECESIYQVRRRRRRRRRSKEERRLFWRINHLPLFTFFSLNVFSLPPHICLQHVCARKWSFHLRKKGWRGKGGKNWTICQKARFVRGRKGRRVSAKTLTPSPSSNITPTHYLGKSLAFSPHISVVSLSLSLSAQMASTLSSSPPPLNDWERERDKPPTFLTLYSLSLSPVFKH